MQLAYLVARGTRQNAIGVFWGELLGLGWVTVCVGSTWEVHEDMEKVLMGASSNPVVRTYSVVMSTIYRPLVRSAPADGSIAEFRSVLDGSFKNYGDRPIPSSANFARLLAVLSAWCIAGLTVAIVTWRLRGGKQEDTNVVGLGAIADLHNSGRVPSPSDHAPKT